MILAVDAAEGVRDFANRGVGFDGGENGGEKIFTVAGAAIQFREGRLRLAGSALCAEGLEIPDLSALAPCSQRGCAIMSS